MTLSDLSFTDYQLASGNTAVYPEVGTGSMLAIAYCALGLGEAGEVQGKVKKILRDSGGVVTEEARDNVKKEIGDILWYCANLASELDLSLEQIAQANLDKLKDRQERGVLGGSGDNR